MRTSTPRPGSATSISEIGHGERQRQLLDRAGPRRTRAATDQQLIDETPEPLDLREHHAERGRLRALHAVEEVLEVSRMR